MKKIMSTLCALTLCLSLAACGAEQKAEPTEEVLLPEETAAAEEAEIAITMDNWEQYFELKTAAEPVLGEDGGIQSWDFFYGVFLKSEYAESFVSGNVDFEIRFDREWRSASVEEDTGAYELGNQISEPLESDFQQKTFAMEDFRNREEIPEGSDFCGTIAGQAFCGSLLKNEAGEWYAEVPANGVILHAEGSLTVLQ